LRRKGRDEAMIHGKAIREDGYTHCVVITQPLCMAVESINRVLSV